MKRYELKYVIAEKNIPFALSYLRSEARFLKAYDVSSIYFDDSRLSSYHAKLDGLYERHKIRIRTYSKKFPDSTMYLEKKKRTGSFISKNRHELTSNEFDLAMKGISNEPWLMGLNPTLNVYYHRDEFLYPWGRVTLDTQITFSSDRFSWKQKDAVLEVRTEKDFEEGWMKWLKKISQVQSFSKYATGMRIKLGEKEW